MGKNGRPSPGQNKCRTIRQQPKQTLYWEERGLAASTLISGFKPHRDSQKLPRTVQRYDCIWQKRHIAWKHEMPVNTMKARTGEHTIQTAAPVKHSQLGHAHYTVKQGSAESTSFLCMFKKITLWLMLIILEFRRKNLTYFNT